MRTNFINQYFIGHGIVLNRIVLYYGSGEKIRHTFGHTDHNETIDIELTQGRQ